MIFSYYFDAKKTHLLNCKFNVLQFIELEQGVNQITFSAEIEEIRNGEVKKREAKTATFQFPPSADSNRHDVDFTRVRYAPQKKWIFTIRNNKKTDQSITVGLISDTANRNPLGMDVYHVSEDYHAHLKGNNLSILEANYEPPVLQQTIARHTFSQPGYPEGFSSKNAQYEHSYQHFVVSEFVQHFKEPIPAHTPFTISLDLAPTEVESNIGYYIFHLNIPELGTVSLLRNGLQYLYAEGNPSDVVRTFFGQSVQPDDFFKNGIMSSKAHMEIKGDGNGNLTVKYYDHVIEGKYDPSKKFKQMNFRGELRNLDN